jgi:sporulation protein YlmC with PRC-barrel domain
MPSATIINFDKHFKGLSVLHAETAWKLGVVADLVIDPGQGTVSGFLLTTLEEEELFLPVEKGVVYKDPFLLKQNAASLHSFTTVQEELDDAYENLPQRLRVTTDLLHASVITEKGQLLGHISEVYVDPKNWQAFYRVTSSWWQRWLGGGVSLPAHVPVRWSQTTGRLVVPADAKENHTFRSQVKDVGPKNVFHSCGLVNKKSNI